MPHAVPLATLAAGLGLMGGAVAGIHQLGGQLRSVQVEQRRVDAIRVSGDAPRGHRCPHPQAAPPAQATLQ